MEGGILRRALDPTFGRAARGRAVVGGLPGDSDTICGAAPAPAGGVVAGVGATLVGLTERGRIDRSFARRGVLAVGRPSGASINALARAPKRRLVLAGAAGSDVFVARYRLPAPR